MPRICEILEALAEQQPKWLRRWGLRESDDETIGYWRTQLERSIAEARTRLAATAARLNGRAGMVANADVISPRRTNK
jgi:hypothetical protein